MSHFPTAPYDSLGLGKASPERITTKSHSLPALDEVDTISRDNFIIFTQRGSRGAGSARPLVDLKQAQKFPGQATSKNSKPVVTCEEKPLRFLFHQYGRWPFSLFCDRVEYSWGWKEFNVNRLLGVDLNLPFSPQKRILIFLMGWRLK